VRGALFAVRRFACLGGLLRVAACFRMWWKRLFRRSVRSNFGLRLRRDQKTIPAPCSSFFGVGAGASWFKVHRPGAPPARCEALCALLAVRGALLAVRRFACRAGWAACFVSRLASECGGNGFFVVQCAPALDYAFGATRKPSRAMLFWTFRALCSGMCSAPRAL
jgi:hypothetical protein